MTTLVRIWIGTVYKINGGVQKISLDRPLAYAAIIIDYNNYEAIFLLYGTSNNYATFNTVNSTTVTGRTGSTSSSCAVITLFSTETSETVPNMCAVVEGVMLYQVTL